MKNVLDMKINTQLLIDQTEEDISKAGFAIAEVLTLENQVHSFRQSVSFIFAGLIAVIIIGFFLIIGLKNGLNTSAILLSNDGLQFITIFVLIIAVVLFGILNILEGRELSAILSGIAGYILGKNNVPATVKENPITPKKNVTITSSE